MSLFPQNSFLFILWSEVLLYWWFLIVEEFLSWTLYADIDFNIDWIIGFQSYVCLRHCSNCFSGLVLNWPHSSFFDWRMLAFLSSVPFHDHAMLSFQSLWVYLFYKASSLLTFSTFISLIRPKEQLCWWFSCFLPVFFSFEKAKLFHTIL
jgi:hypothetical protein